MFYRKRGLPQEGEIVLCTVTSIKHHSVFVYLDVYRIDGLIHISEVSAGRIRNIRDYVKEGKKVVCKVLRVKQQRKQVDLSLRRVTDTQRREKVSEIKQEQKAEKIIEHVAHVMEEEPKKVYKEVYGKIRESYMTLHEFFQDVVDDETTIEEFEIHEKVAPHLEEAIRKRIKPTEVTIKGILKLSSYDENGVEKIKTAVRKADVKGVEIKYLGGGNYDLIVTAPDYKSAESIIKDASTNAIEHVSDNGFGEFKRKK